MMLDFDEILLSVKNSQVKKYLEESIKSYRIGNYRSAIIAVWVAAMFDIVKKFEILVDQREPTAIDKWRKLEPKIKEHKNWERELIDAAKDAAMISMYEANILHELRETRNRYAHPSFDDIGTLFDPSPEEVRYFIRVLYDIVLSQPAQLGAFYVNQLLEEIKNPTFFPGKDRYFRKSKFSASYSMSELPSVKELVIKKVNLINNKQIPRLIKELFQALEKPIIECHKFNILTVLIHLWGNQYELKLPVKISEHWDNYISLIELDDVNLEAILTYPECVNELSKYSQDKIAFFFREYFIKHRYSTQTATKFLASADIVPLAKLILDEVSPEIIPISEIIDNIKHYQYLFGDEKFVNIFGKYIFEETKKIFKSTIDGYTVNPVLNALRCCGIWNMANLYCLGNEEKADFASDLVNSLNCNHWNTMGLLSFNNRTNIPIEWVDLLLMKWSEKLEKESRFQKNLPIYWEHYLGLVERYINERGIYTKLEQGIKILVNSLVNNTHSLEQISQLSSNELLWLFWQDLLKNHKNLISSSPLEKMM